MTILTCINIKYRRSNKKKITVRDYGRAGADEIAPLRLLKNGKYLAVGSKSKHLRDTMVATLYLSTSIGNPAMRH